MPAYTGPVVSTIAGVAFFSILKEMGWRSSFPVFFVLMAVAFECCLRQRIIKELELTVIDELVVAMQADIARTREICT